MGVRAFAILGMSCFLSRESHAGRQMKIVSPKGHHVSNRFTIQYLQCYQNNPILQDFR
jgi:hypothetical protein